MPELMPVLSRLKETYKDLQLVSVMPDTAGLAQWKASHDLPVPCANLQSHAAGRTLNLGNGYPSCVLVNREGIVVRISGAMFPEVFDEQAFGDKIRELMLF